MGLHSIRVTLALAFYPDCMGMFYCFLSRSLDPVGVWPRIHAAVPDFSEAAHRVAVGAACTRSVGGGLTSFLLSA